VSQAWAIIVIVKKLRVLKKEEVMSLSEFASVATNGKSVSFIYHGTRRIGEIVEAIILPNGGKPFGYITIDEKKDGFRRFSVRKMSEIELV
jgi:hypothetical protein